MAIFRNRSQSFTVVDNYALKDTRLSLKTLGLLVKMLSLPDNWDFSEAGLAAIIKDGKTSIRSGLKELEEYGYVSRKQVRTPDGKFKDWEWEVYSKPQTETPKSENPISDSKYNKILNELNTNKQKTKPSLDNVLSFCSEQGISDVVGMKFYTYYNERSWCTNHQPIKDWQKLLLSWNSKEIHSVHENMERNAAKREIDMNDEYMQAFASVGAL